MQLNGHRIVYIYDPLIQLSVDQTVGPTVKRCSLPVKRPA